MPSYTSQTKMTVMNDAYSCNYVNGNHKVGYRHSVLTSAIINPSTMV